ncbi:hypothetical protein BHE74_00046574 [Ensete ventricosum]|uniref:Mei2-like C-terminal RNA recognition motif domain-containing protein n=1 Tax=Ensete ventricosum TaxID=4639 RepID=A0A445MLV2_ENSVE|nr:hypothetical protein BHE74_00046574 [Ensete ventricosum]RZR75216.1 hypothetical protein BHM03_00052031 [Ensete ventricosum]
MVPHDPQLLLHPHSLSLNILCLAICTGNMDQNKEHSVSEADNSSSQLKTHSKYLEGEFIVDELNFQEDDILLPSNEEDLLAGIMDGFDLTNLPKLVDASEDCDLFGSVGGFELDSGPTESITASMEKVSVSDSYAENGISQHNLPNGFGTVSSEHPYGSDCLPGLSTILSPVMSNSTKVGLIKDQEKVNYADQLYSGSNSSPHEGRFQHCGSSRDHSSGILSSSPGPLFSLGPSASNASGFGSLTGSQFPFGSPTSYMDQPQSSWRPPVTGLPFPSNGRQQRQNIFYSNQHDSFPGSSHGQRHPVGSAPPGVPFKRHYSYFPETPETSVMNQVAFQNSGSGPTALWNPGIVFTGNIPDNSSPKPRMMQYQRSGPNFFGNNPYPGSGSFGLQGHSRQFDSQGSQDDNKKRYLLDLDKIVRGEDTRTTLMIKNIPNKYGSRICYHFLLIFGIAIS